MSTPAYTRTWVQKLTTGTPGARISYVSLIDTMQQYIYGVKTFLLANGYTLLWSASAGTGPTNAGDHTDRITSAATFSPRGAGAGNSQGWFVLTDGNGAQLLVAYQGASDDICRISYSPGALFVQAGATNQQPTATDECLITAGVTVVGATASADRVWHGWVTADAKNCRFMLYRSSVVVGQVWGLELYTLPTLPGSVSFVPSIASNAVWGFCFSDTSAPSAVAAGFGANVRGGLSRALISAVAFNVQAALSTWSASNVVAPQVLSGNAALQGTSGFTPWPLTLVSVMASADGYVGALVDWYLANPTGFSAGDGFGSAYQWVQVGVLLFPNPSVTAPTIA